jgi:hypothetical protein
VIKPDEDNGGAPSLELRFLKSQQYFPASTLTTVNPGLDLAVVVTPVENLPSDMPKVAKGDAKARTAAYIIGHPADRDWSVWSGTVQNENLSGNIHQFVTNLDKSLGFGYSGGAVFDSDGRLIGMHTSSSPTYGIATKITEIINQLAAWQVPTDNVAPFGVVTEGSIIGPPPDWAGLYKEDFNDEVALGNDGASAYYRDKYEWSVKFFERAKAIQKNRVWQSKYPLYAADLFILGKSETAKTILEEMHNEMLSQHVYLSHATPIRMVIANLQTVRPKVPTNDRPTVDQALRQANQRLQEVMSKPSDSTAQGTTKPIAVAQNTLTPTVHVAFEKHRSEYEGLKEHKSIAISERGWVGISANQLSELLAEEKAISFCKDFVSRSDQPADNCFVLMVDDKKLGDWIIPTGDSIPLATKELTAKAHGAFAQFATQYQGLKTHRSIAVSDGGWVGMSENQASELLAEEKALGFCIDFVRKSHDPTDTCRVLMVDERELGTWSPKH